MPVNERGDKNNYSPNHRLADVTKDFIEGEESVKQSGYFITK